MEVQRSDWHRQPPDMGQRHHGVPGHGRRGACHQGNITQKKQLFRPCLLTGGIAPVPVRACNCKVTSALHGTHVGTSCIPTCIRIWLLYSSRLYLSRESMALVLFSKDRVWILNHRTLARLENGDVRSHSALPQKWQLMSQTVLTRKPPIHYHPTGPEPSRLI